MTTKETAFKLTGRHSRLLSAKPINSKTTVARGSVVGNRNVSRTALRQEVVTLRSTKSGEFQAEFLFT
jgi:hypothetical protein